MRAALPWLVSVGLHAGAFLVAAGFMARPDLATTSAAAPAAVPWAGQLDWTEPASAPARFPVLRSAVAGAPPLPRVASAAVLRTAAEPPRTRHGRDSQAARTRAAAPERLRRPATRTMVWSVAQSVSPTVEERLPARVAAPVAREATAIAPSSDTDPAGSATPATASATDGADAGAAETTAPSLRAAADGATAGGLAATPGAATRSAPAAYLDTPQPVYPEAARRAGLEGLVVLRARVTAAGLPETIRVLHSSGTAMLDRAALTGVGAWRFLPAQLGGQAVAGWLDIPVRFSLAADRADGVARR